MTLKCVGGVVYPMPVSFFAAIWTAWVFLGLGGFCAITLGQHSLRRAEVPEAATAWIWSQESRGCLDLNPLVCEILSRIESRWWGLLILELGGARQENCAGVLVTPVVLALPSVRLSASLWL